MTNEQHQKIKSLIYESELAAMVYGRQIQQLEMLPPTNDCVILQARHNIEEEYRKRWGDATKALHDYIENLLKD